MYFCDQIAVNCSFLPKNKNVQTSKMQKFCAWIFGLNPQWSVIPAFLNAHIWHRRGNNHVWLRPRWVAPYLSIINKCAPEASSLFVYSLLFSIYQPKSEKTESIKQQSSDKTIGGSFIKMIVFHFQDVREASLPFHHVLRQIRAFFTFCLLLWCKLGTYSWMIPEWGRDESQNSE